MVVVQDMFRGMTARRLFKSKKREMLVLAAARAAEAKRQAEEAKRRQEEARIAAEQARRESIARAAVEDDRALMEEETRAAEAEAIRLGKELRLRWLSG